MKLIQDTSNKLFTIYQDFRLRNFDIASVWYFYKVYNLALAVTGFQDKLERKKNRSWRNYINAVVHKNMDAKSKYLTELENYMPLDMVVINQAMKILEEQNRTDPINKNNLWKRGIIGIPSYDID